VSAPPRVTIYAKPGCHLCDEMKALVARVAVRVPLTLEEVDVTRDPALLAEYGEQIPVLFIDGRKAAKHRIDERALERRLTERGWFSW